MSVKLPSVSQLSSFLSKRGWTERSGQKRLSFSTGERYETEKEVSYRIFELQAEQEKLVVPMKPDGSAAARYLEQAMMVLSRLYQTPVEHLAVAMQAENIDVLFGIHARSTVTLERAHEIIANLKNVIAQAANTELNPQPYSGDSRGNRIVDEVNFGHTFAGSFGFRIECPLRTEDRQMELEENRPAPMERRLLQRLAYGLLTLEEAARSESVSLICENYLEGLNGNICDALLDLCEPTDLEPFTFRFEWSTMFPLIIPLRNRQMKFAVTARKYAMLEEASQEFKRMMVQPRAQLIGRVVGLNSEVPPLQRGLLAHRKVTLQIIGGEYDDSKMQLEVSDSDYQLALEAHGEGKIIRTQGIPVQRGTHWRIEDHEGLYYV